MSLECRACTRAITKTETYNECVECTAAVCQACFGDARLHLLHACVSDHFVAMGPDDNMPQMCCLCLTTPRARMAACDDEAASLSAHLSHASALVQNFADCRRDAVIGIAKCAHAALETLPDGLDKGRMRVMYESAINTCIRMVKVGGSSEYIAFIEEIMQARALFASS